MQQKPVPHSCQGNSQRSQVQGFKISTSAKFTANQLQEILEVPPKSPFKQLLLKTPLWQCAMSTIHKSLPESLKDLECKKGTLTIWPPTPYVPAIDLHKKRDTEQIKIKLTDETNYQMSAFSQGNNEGYLVCIIAVKHLLKQKGTVQDVGQAFGVGGPVQNLSNFQMAPITILSVLTCSTSSPHDTLKVWWKIIDHTPLLGRTNVMIEFWVGLVFGFRWVFY